MTDPQKGKEEAKRRQIESNQSRFKLDRGIQRWRWWRGPQHSDPERRAWWEEGSQSEGFLFISHHRTGQIDPRENFCTGKAGFSLYQGQIDMVQTLGRQKHSRFYIGFQWDQNQSWKHDIRFHEAFFGPERSQKSMALYFWPCLNRRLRSLSKTNWLKMLEGYLVNFSQP